MVDPEELVVDEALDDVEGAPAREQRADMYAPRRSEPALLPGTHRHDHRRRDEDPCAEMEEAVGERVHFQVCHGVGRSITGEHVMPLEDLVEDDAVQEPAESEAHDEAGRARHDHVRCSTHRLASYNRGVSAGGPPGCVTAGTGAADLGVGATVGHAAPAAASVLAGVQEQPAAVTALPERAEPLGA